MADLREDVALAGNPTNLWSEGRVRDGDVKLGALGKADALGGALWRLKYRGDASVAKRALLLLAARLREDHRWQKSVSGRGAGARGKRGDRDDRGEGADIIDRLAFRVLYEWVNDRCTTCYGRGSLGVLGKVAICGACGGSTKQPPQHATRAKDLGVTLHQYRNRWEWVFERLLVQLEQVDDDVKATLKSEIACTTLPPSVDRKAA